MNKIKVAKSLLSLAKQITRKADEIETEKPGMFKKIDPKLNMIVNKIDSAVGPDLDSLLTAVLMVMRRHNYNKEANQLYTLFKPIMKRMQGKLSTSSVKNRRRLTK